MLLLTIVHIFLLYIIAKKYIFKATVTSIQYRFLINLIRTFKRSIQQYLYSL
jgi:hypothetical protein